MADAQASEQAGRSALPNLLQDGHIALPQRGQTDVASVLCVAHFIGTGEWPNEKEISHGKRRRELFSFQPSSLPRSGVPLTSSNG